MSLSTGGLDGAAGELARALDGSVRRAVEGENRVAVAFSGGLDSSVLVACARRYSEVVACTGHAAGSLDEKKGAEVAAALGVEHVVAELTPAKIEAELSRLELPFVPTMMDKGLWCLYSLVAQAARGAGARVILLGQLADELFGGYSKYLAALERAGPEEASSMMEADFRDYSDRGKVRDRGACSRWLEPRLPFEDAEVVRVARSMPLSFKIADGVRKAVLRKAAVVLGVPEEVASTAKKAAQYSSGIQKVVAGSRF